MNILTAIKGFVMKILNLNQIETATNTAGVLSAEMKDRIELWAHMYQGIADWNDDAPSCGIEKVIAGSLSDPITEEIKIASDNAELQTLMQKVQEDVNTIIEYFVAFGGCVIRPVFSNSKIQYEIVHLGNYLPLAYDIDGTLIKAIITKRLSEGKKEYLLCETHSFENRTHKVDSTLYKMDSGIIGAELPLTSIVQTADITPHFEWQNVEKPFIIEFRNREPNKIDGSNVPCALIAGVENLIKDADEQYSRLIWENEAGKLKLFADADLFDKRQTKDGSDTVTHLNPTLRKLFVKLNGDGTSTEKITTFAPTLRNNDLITGLNKIFQQIEIATNIGKGTISDLADIHQTATQFAGGKKAFYSKIDKYETELEAKYKDTAYVFAYMLSAYLNIPFNPEIEITYNDMTRKDPKELKMMALQEVAAGIMSKAQYRMQFYGETEEEAEANVPEDTNSMGGLFGNV